MAILLLFSQQYATLCMLSPLRPANLSPPNRTTLLSTNLCVICIIAPTFPYYFRIFPVTVPYHLRIPAR